MGNKRRRNSGENKPAPATRPAQDAQVGPELAPQRLPTLLTILTVVGVYGWMLSCYNGFLYGFYTNHVADNFRVLAAFFNLVSTTIAAALTLHIYDAAWTVAIFASALALGRLVLDLSRFEFAEDDWGPHLKALAMGLGLFSLVLLLLGMLSLWTKPAMIVLVLVPLIVGIVRYRTNLVPRPDTWRFAAWLKAFSHLELLGFLLLGAYLLMNLIGALGPEYFYDSLVYHLTMPQLYLLYHRIVPTPSMIYSGVPFGTEMLYGLGLGLGSVVLAKLIHFGFGLAIASAIYCWTKNVANRKAALLATVLFYSVPMVCFESVVATVELSMTFYLLMAALIIVDTMQSDAAASNPKILLLAGAFAGFGFGTKYNAGLYIPALALPFIIKGLRNSADRKGQAYRIALFVGAAALTFSPWALKNWILYHNPTYPFLQGLFPHGPSADVAGLEADAHARNLHLAITTWDGLKDFFLGIWNPVSHRVDSYVGPSMEIGLPWLILVRWESNRFRSLLVILVGIWLAWALHTALPRFLMPAIPLFCILAASAVSLVNLPKAMRYPILGAVWYTSLISLAVIFMMLSESGTWRAATGRISAADYLLHEHPAYSAPYYAGAAFINQNLPQDAKVLFIGEERGFYCERKFITASVFDVNPMAALADASVDADALLTNLRQAGVTHLLVNIGSEHYQRWLQGLTPGNRTKYETLIRSKAKLIFDYNKQSAPNDRSWVQVFQLEDAPLKNAS